MVKFSPTNLLYLCPSKPCISEMQEIEDLSGFFCYSKYFIDTWILMLNYLILTYLVLTYLCLDTWCLHQLCSHTTGLRFKMMLNFFDYFYVHFSISNKILFWPSLHFLLSESNYLKFDINVGYQCVVMKSQLSLIVKHTWNWHDFNLPKIISDDEILETCIGHEWTNPKDWHFIVLVCESHYAQRVCVFNFKLPLTWIVVNAEFRISPIDVYSTMHWYFSGLLSL